MGGGNQVGAVGGGQRAGQTRADAVADAADLLVLGDPCQVADIAVTWRTAFGFAEMLAIGARLQTY